MMMKKSRRKKMKKEKEKRKMKLTKSVKFASTIKLILFWSLVDTCVYVKSVRNYWQKITNVPSAKEPFKRLLRHF